MSKKLHIIGNGFDIWHGLPTSYKCFNCFMRRMHPENHEKIGKMYNRLDSNMLWSDFENELGNLNIPEFVERNIDIWTHCDINTIENLYDELYDDLKSHFHEWVLDVDYSIANKKRINCISNDKNAQFITFNYTNTLERFYEVEDDRICYIHGNTADNEVCRPVVGHGTSDDEIEENAEELWDDIHQFLSQYSLPKYAADYDEWTKKIEYEIVDLLKYLRKNTAECKKLHETFLKKIVDYTDVYVLGHSLSKIDALYFEEIYHNNQKAKWYISFLEGEDKMAKEQSLYELLNVKQGEIQVELFTMDEMCFPISTETSN